MVPGVLYAAAFVIAAELITAFQVTQQTRYLLAGVGCLFGIATMVLFLRWEQDRWYWELTETGLVSGKRKKKIYLLSDIVRLLDGIPDSGSLVKSFIGMINPRIRAMLSHCRGQAFLLMFRDGSLLPLHIHACEGGTRLMEELKARLSDRVYPTWKLSETEASALRMADWNRAVHPKTDMSSRPPFR